jgi:hypothetical protein
VFVCSPNAVMDIPNREINRVVFMLTSSDGNSCLIGAEDDGNEHRPMCCRIHRNDILCVSCE